jgi:hypothetical protein
MAGRIGLRAAALGIIALNAGLLGCGDKDEEDTGGEIVEAGGDGDQVGVCEGTIPVVDGLSCVNTGIQPHYETGEDTVTMALLVDMSDEDGDLHQYRMEIFIDEEIDGVVASADSPFGPVNRTLNVDECAGYEADVELTLYLTGLNPAYDTEYDWGIILTDAAGYESDMFVTSCITPAADGSDGTGAGG